MASTPARRVVLPGAGPLPYIPGQFKKGYELLMGRLCVGKALRLTLFSEDADLRPSRNESA